MAEKACGSNAHDEFAFELQQTTFKLPTVRFDDAVPPPPPPPAFLSAFQQLVESDPDGFQAVSTRLDALFPQLNHVAQSSIGATIHNSDDPARPYLGAETVTPQQLTRAFLASHGMEPNSLGARVVESKHTGTARAHSTSPHIAQKAGKATFPPPSRFGLR